MHANKKIILLKCDEKSKFVNLIWFRNQIYSVVGAIGLVGGLYFVLRGKASEEHNMKEQVPLPTNADAEDECWSYQQNN